MLRKVVLTLKAYAGSGIYILSLFFFMAGVEMFVRGRILKNKSEIAGFIILAIATSMITAKSGYDISRLANLCIGISTKVFGDTGTLIVIGVLFLIGFLSVVEMGLFEVLDKFKLLFIKIIKGIKFFVLLLWNFLKLLFVSVLFIYSRVKTVILKRVEHIKFSKERQQPLLVCDTQETSVQAHQVLEDDKPDKEIVEHQEEDVAVPQIVQNRKTNKPEKEKKTLKQDKGDSKEIKSAEDSQASRPTSNLLDPIIEEEDLSTAEELHRKARILVSTLKEFGIQSEVINIVKGPAVTRFELSLGSGIVISRVNRLHDNLRMALANTNIRLETPIPGKSAIGVEVPNKNPRTVYFKEILDSKQFEKMGKKSPLTIILGKTIAGEPVVADLARMPHLLIAGATGSGKSVCMNTIISSMLFNAKMNEVRFIMIDPKRVELSVYNGIPQLLYPVVTDPKDAALVLTWTLNEMDERYSLLARYGIKGIKQFNKFVKEKKEVLKKNPDIDDSLREMYQVLKELPYIVVAIDELADLMMVAKSDVEITINRLAAMARAVGIHLIVATQRPSVDVITGLIKANLPTRIAFAVTSQTDSRTILDMKGAESLLGRGDMLYSPVGVKKPIRVQGALIKDEEVERLVHYWRTQSPARYDETIKAFIESSKQDEPASKGETSLSSKDEELYKKALEIVKAAGYASTSMLQRKLKIGYGRAARFIDVMEEQGLIGEYSGGKRPYIGHMKSSYQSSEDSVDSNSED